MSESSFEVDSVTLLKSKVSGVGDIQNWDFIVEYATGYTTFVGVSKRKNGRLFISEYEVKMLKGYDYTLGKWIDGEMIDPQVMGRYAYLENRLLNLKRGYSV